MTRMIERWFPCTEVSESSGKGWGSGRSENALFVWFAARPIAQAKAAVLTSLLPWPEDEAEQKRLQEIVRAAMRDRYGAWEDVRREIVAHYSVSPRILDPFSGRGTIPLEAARLGINALGVDYSPLASLGSELLTDYPFRDWSKEPALPFGEASLDGRLTADVRSVLAEIGRRCTESMASFYPASGGSVPWGYLWAMTLPCQECGRRFPLFGSNELRRPETRPATKSKPAFHDSGQSFYVEVDQERGTFEIVVHEGAPLRPPTLVAGLKADGKRAKGKAAVCPFCDHAHPLAVHQRLAQEKQGEDYLLVVADIDTEFGKTYRSADERERIAAADAAVELRRERPFSPLLSAVPTEQIPENNGATIRPQLYGATAYGDICVGRQTLAFVRTARIINELGQELLQDGLSMDYVRCLSAYAASVLVKRIRYSTRGAILYVRNQQVGDVFANEGTLNFSHDFFEAGIGDGPGTWTSVSASEISTLKIVTDGRGSPAEIARGSATALPYRDESVAAVVTDPPYDAMVYYSDLSDVFYCWVKRALAWSRPEIAVTGDPRGLQDKQIEIIVKEHGKAPGEHRDRAHYDSNISRAFSEMRRVVATDGVVTIVFGHGEPEVWHRLLTAIHGGGLVLTSSWPARTESGSRQNKANIETTLTMACRPAPPNREVGRAAAVEAEVKREVAARMAHWSRSGLAPTDMLMASAGPAMEVVGRYSDIVNNKGVSVAADHYLVVARRAVQDAEAVEIDHHPLDTFDARTRFALWWVRLYRKSVAAKSELRWQALASDMEVAAVRDLVPDADKGCRFVSAKEFRAAINDQSSVINVALAMARAWPEGLDAVGEVLLASGRDQDDSFLWAAVSFLADRIPDGDADAIAWNNLLRARKGVASAAKGVSAARKAAGEIARNSSAQASLFETDEEAE